jgi:hypothetical protein
MNLFQFVYFLHFGFCCFGVYSVSNPSCSDTVFVNGVPSVYATLQNCLSNIADPILPPSYVEGYGSTVVVSDMLLNNLHQVSEIEGAVTLDFYFRLYWLDPRLNMTSFFKDANPEIAVQGSTLSYN